MSFGGFSFGSTAQQPAAQPQQSSQLSVPSFSFTGATPSTTPTPANAPPSASSSNPFSFGSNSTSNAQPAAGASTSLFGGLNNSTNSTGSTGGGFSFGNPAQATASGSSLFGQPAQGNQQAGTSTNTSLFSSSTPAQQQNQNQNLFQNTSLLGSSQNQNQNQNQNQGQNQNQNQNQAQGQGQGWSRNTKFSDAPVGLQNMIEQLDSWIKQQKSAGQGINTDDLGKAIWRTSTEARSASEESSAITQSITNLTQSLMTLRDRFLTEEEDLRKIAEIWETYKAVDGRPGALRTSGHTNFPIEFFGRTARGMEERVGRYKSSIGQLNRVVAGLARDTEGPTPQAIVQTIQNHQTAITSLAAQLERLQLRLTNLKDAYSAEYRDRTNSLRDPFEIAREEKGMSPVRI